MRYTVAQFNLEYPNEDACLDKIFQERYGDVKDCPYCGVIDTKFYRVRGRKCYACMHCSYQLHPLADTIFHKSSTPLRSWFYAIYLFSVSKNGVAAKELERHLGVTYKTAHRMAKQIRSLMSEESPIGGPGTIVEADETYFGKRNNEGLGPRVPKSAVLGAVERGGRVRARVVQRNVGKNVFNFINDTVQRGTELHTDESRLYNWTKVAYVHHTVNHSKGQYALNGITTNSIEGFWGQVKRSISGTYHAVSPKYLQMYVDEFSFRYSYRDVVVYPVLLERVWTRVG